MALPKFSPKIFSQSAAVGLVALAALPFTAHAGETAPIAPHCHPANIDQSKTYTAEEAAHMSEGGRIVFHYDSNAIKDADIVAIALSRDGYPATAMGGRQDGKVAVYIHGKQLKHQYSQDELDNGRLVGTTASVYDYATNEKHYFDRPNCTEPLVAGL